jgi:DNA adenine methylase
VHRTPTTREDALTSPESYYYWVRSRFNQRPNDEPPSVDASAMLLFLNKTCFRGVYREGPRGFNVPFGHYTRPSILDAAHIRTVSALIREVVFTHRPFGDSLAQLESGDFVYLDPPYAPQNPTSFVSYTSDGFDLTHHTQLFQRCAAMSAMGVKMLMSNADVALVRNAFPSPPFTTKVINCRRAIHSRQPNARTDEVLITNVQDNMLVGSTPTVG